MLRVGLTGGIATGKSTVARMFRRLGVRTMDADAITHGLQQPRSLIWKKIVGAFGRDILCPDLSLDRRKLGEIVFSDPEKRALLEQIMHPAVIAEEEELMSEWERSGDVDLVMVEEALLIESGSYRRYGRIVLVVAPEKIQIERLKERGFTEEEAKSRIRSQMPLSEKMKWADYVIDNSGDRSGTERAVERIYQQLRAESDGLK